VPVGTFAVPGQAHTALYLACDDGVFASVMVKETAEPGQYALVRWQPDGTVAWRKPMPMAVQLVRAGGVLALAYDDGSLEAQRGLLMVDAATGKVLAETSLDGRPYGLSYYPRERLFITLLYPQHRLRTLTGAWMEARAFTPEGREAWRWKIDATELAPGCMDGRRLIVCAGLPGNPRVTRLDPATGGVVWQRTWPDARQGAPIGTAGVVCAIAKWSMPGSLVWLDPDTGAMAPLLTPDGAPFRWLRYCTTADRLYAAATPEMMQQVELHALALPEGRPAWTNTFRHFAGAVTDPVVWGDRVAVLYRTLVQDPGQRVQDIRLQIFRTDGALLATVGPNLLLDDSKPMQVAGDRLYVAQRDGVVALAWKE